MRLVRIKARNFMGLRNVLVVINDGVTKVVGLNEAGKSSLLTGVCACLFGAKRAEWDWERPDVMLRQGTEDGYFELGMDDGTTLRLNLEEGKSAKLIGHGPPPPAGGRKKKGPVIKQRDLNAKLSALGAEPGALLGMSNDQLDAVLVRLLGMEFCGRAEELDTREEELYTLRHKLGVQLDDMGNIAKVDEIEPVSTEALAQEMAEVEAYNEVQRKRGAAVDQAELAAIQWDKDEQAAALLVSERTAQLAAARAKLEKVQEGKAGHLEAQQALPLPEDMRSTEDVQRRIGEAGAINEQAAEYKRYLEKVAAHRELRDRHEQADQDLENIRAVKKEHHKSAQLPVEGLTRGRKGIRLDGLPLAQVNEAKRFKIFLKLLVADQPELRFIVIRDNNPLDHLSMAEALEIAYAEGLDVLIEEKGVVHGGNLIRLVDGESVAEDDKRWQALVRQQLRAARVHLPRGR